MKALEDKNKELKECLVRLQYSMEDRKAELGRVQCSMYTIEESICKHKEDQNKLHNQVIFLNFY
jgi:hypothetical protein